MGAEGMRQRAKDMADKLRQMSQGGQSGKSRHKDQGHKRIEEQMRKLQERRHRHR